MQRHRSTPVRNRPIARKFIRRETEEDDGIWDDAILVLGGDDKPTASESGG
jgi:hypothetical protein